MNNLTLFGGIIFIVSGYALKKFGLYYENTILPSKEKKEQDLYWKIEKEKSEKGAYNVPFKEGKLIATHQNKQAFYNYIIILGILALLLGLLGW